MSAGKGGAAVGDAALFSGRKIGKHIVREWSYRQAHDLLPFIIACAKECQAKGITLDTFQERWEDVAYVLMPHGPQIIARTLRIDEAEAWEMGWAEVGALLYGIAMENWEHVKNWIGPAMGIDLASLVEKAMGSSGPSTSS